MINQIITMFSSNDPDDKELAFQMLEHLSKEELEKLNCWYISKIANIDNFEIRNRGGMALGYVYLNRLLNRNIYPIGLELKNEYKNFQL